MTRDDWLRAHAFLQPVARLTTQIEAAVNGLGAPTAAVPRLDDYRDEYHAGVPLLRSETAAIDLEPAGRAVVTLVERLAAAPIPGDLPAQMHALLAELQAERAAAAAVAEWLRGDSEFSTASPGLLRFLGWNVLARFLRPVVAAYATWRDEARWHRATCPTCGSPPAMAHLVAEEHGRTRFLVCGGCVTCWRFPRGSCPFCEKETHQMQVVSIEGEGGLRLDACAACRGYLKTYAGRGDEALLLADWTSLHLDVVALDRGWSRRASSLYEVETGAPAD